MATLYHHSHAKQAVKFIIIIIIVWNVHDQVYIFMLVILMHSALCIYFILLNINWCHDTASACLYSNCIVISNVMVEYEYIRILIMLTILIAQQLTAVKARYLWVGSVVLYVSMAGHMILILWSVRAR